MLQTFEADLNPNGMLHFYGTDAPRYANRQKVLVTVMTGQPIPSVTQPAATIKTLAASQSIRQAWTNWGSGALVGSPNFNQDPVVIQQAMRDEQR